MSVARCTGACTGGHASSAKNFPKREAPRWVCVCGGVDWRARRRSQVSRRMWGVHVHESLSGCMRIAGQARQTGCFVYVAPLAAVEEGALGWPSKKWQVQEWVYGESSRHSRRQVVAAAAALTRQERSWNSRRGHAMQHCLEDENAAAAGFQEGWRPEGNARSNKATGSPAREAGLPVRRLTAINLVRGALLHHPRSVAGSKLAAHVQE